MKNAKICDKKYTVLHTTYENNYKLNPEDLSKCPKNSLLIFNNVCNSTGVVYKKEEVKNILNECKKLDITILSDETYYNLCQTNLYNIKKNYFFHSKTNADFMQLYTASPGKFLEI